MILKYKSALLLAFLLLFRIGQAQELVLNAESEIVISGTSSLHDWDMNSALHYGKLKIEEGKVKEVQVRIKTGGLKSTKGATMDGKAHRALKNEEHPYIEFYSNDPVDLSGEFSTYQGSLSLAGVKKEMKADILSIEQTDACVTIIGKLAVNMTEFEIEPPSAMFGQIVTGDEVKVSFKLIFIQE